MSVSAKHLLQFRMYVIEPFCFSHASRGSNINAYAVDWCRTTVSSARSVSFEIFLLQPECKETQYPHLSSLNLPLVPIPLKLPPLRLQIMQHVPQIHMHHPSTTTHASHANSWGTHMLDMLLLLLLLALSLLLLLLRRVWVLVEYGRRLFLRGIGRLRVLRQRN
ncbi:hypothetical protein BT69DRAFT_49738 [Atractiella rhizophila]|nr:hypothetical protein BT69DRAFT_49738 [Atractiella rhizophila]